MDSSPDNTGEWTSPASRRAAAGEARDSMRRAQAAARLAGPVLCAIGLGMLINQATYREIATQFLAGTPFIYFSGVLLLVGGLAILNAHPVWTPDWRSALTAFGWIMSGIGAFRLIAPQFVTFIGSSIFADKGFFLGAGLIFLALGALFSSKGYVSNAASENDQ